MAKEGALDLERKKLEVGLNAEKIVVLLFEIVEEEGRFVVGCIIEEVELLLVLELEDDEGEVVIGWLTDEIKELFESEMKDKAGVIGWVIEEVGLSAVLEMIGEEGTEVGKLWSLDWTLVDKESKVLLALIDSVEEEVRERQIFSNFITWALRSEIFERRVEMDKRLDLIQKGHRKGYYQQQ